MKGWRRLWQPRRGIFWLMLAFNGLSSLMAWALHWWQPAGALYALIAVLALVNAGMGWWAMAMLWRTLETIESEGNKHVQGSAGQQDR